jgi:ubiquinone/menaquinone biosynthesis C-methylase UbiE
MHADETRQTREFWERVARDWDIQVGDDGDSNRMPNSDPVLWRFAGDVAGRTVLDAGCGTGYLARKLVQRGAHVIAIDFSPQMCEIARAKAPGMDVRLDSCANLATMDDASIDLVFANYVLMDTPDLEGTIRAFHRILKPGGEAIVVFSHPCFPQGRASVCAADGRTEYHWDFAYFQRQKCVDPPWAHFTSEFIWFHRPLSDYWKAFQAAGFRIDDFDEPRVSQENFRLAEKQGKLPAYKSRPYSVAFKLSKQPPTKQSPNDLV